MADQGFTVQWERWIAERTFAWLNNCRRLSKDYEKWPENHEGVAYDSLNRDPFDRMIMAQAELESLPLITDDNAFHPGLIQVIPSVKKRS